VFYLLNVFKEVKSLPQLKLFLTTTAECSFKRFDMQRPHTPFKIRRYTKAQLLK